MPSASYGIVIEGFYDTGVYEELIWKATSSTVKVVSRPTGGLPALLKSFPVFLREFEHVMEGQPVDRALVIRDAGGKDPAVAEADMRRRIAGRQFRFRDGVHFYAVKRAMETLLLADVEAINAVAAARGGRLVNAVQGSVEDIQDPKERLQRLLAEAQLPYNEQVCREIASQIGLETLLYRCQRFALFIQMLR